MNQETPEEKKLRIERQIDDANAYVAWAKRFGKFPLLKTAIATRGAAIGPRVALNKLRRKIDPIDPEYAKLLDQQASQITKESARKRRQDWRNHALARQHICT